MRLRAGNKEELAGVVAEEAGEEVPGELRDLFATRFPAEEIVLNVCSDVTLGAQFGEAWLLAGKSHLAVAEKEENGYNFRLVLSLAEIKKANALNLVGGGILELETEKHIYRAISYSNARNQEFAHAAHVIQALAKGEPPPAPDDKNKRRFCQSCGLPIPEDLGTCPRCVKKVRTLRRLLLFVQPYRRLLAFMFLLSVVATVFGLAPPWIVGKVIIDKVLEGPPFPYAHLLGPLALGLLVSHAGQIFMGGWQARVGAVVGHSAVHGVRSALYRKLQALSLSFYDKRQTGAIMARVNQDTRELQRFVVDFIPLALESLLRTLGIGVILFILSWPLTLLVILPIGLTIVFLKTFWPRVHVYFHRYFERRSRLSALVADTLSGIRVVKAFGQERSEEGRFKGRSEEFRDAGIELEKVWAVFHPFIHFLIISGSIIVWYVGGTSVLAGNMTVGDIVTYGFYLAMFHRPIFVLTRFTTVISNSLSACERIFEVLDTEPEIQDAPDAVAVPKIKGEIEFRDVTFGYNKFKPVIHNLTLDIKPGEMIGLVGRSGAGKSTTINLLIRLYDVDKGEILIDGINVKKVRYEDLRRQMGVVLQDTFLFDGTMAENIAYARPGATRREIVEAARAANAHEFIIKKPDSYDTRVGERGIKLSAGERQRISIARAILHNPRILILDEATSSVDTETEKKIQEALTYLVRGRTTIAIAHRLSTLKNCSRLVVMDEGKPMEIGTHDELLARKGLFHRLVEMQEELSKIKGVDG